MCDLLLQPGVSNLVCVTLKLMHWSVRPGPLKRVAVSRAQIFLPPGTIIKHGGSSFSGVRNLSGLKYEVRV